MNELNEFHKERIKDAGDFPNVILIDTCSYCNLSCSMCFHDKMQRKKGKMPWELFTKIIDEIALEDKNVRVWMIFFGDPFVIKNTKPSIFDMISYAKNKGLTDVVLNTNANLMDKEASKKLVEAGLDAIYIGIDAFTKETYEKYRVGGDYEKVKRNVIDLIETKKETRAEKPEVFVQFVEMDGNKHEKDDYINFWKKAGATVKTRPMVSWAGKVEAANLTMDNDERWPCHWAMQTMSITDQGDAVNCAVDLDAGFVAGNVAETSIKEVWNNGLKINRLHHHNREWDKLPDICSGCKDWQSATSEYVTEES